MVRSMDQVSKRLIAGAAISALMLGAVYLYAVRGEAILMDLAAMGSALLCL